MSFHIGTANTSKPSERFIPNPKLKLLDQVSEVMRFKRHSLRTETTYREWIRRYILFELLNSKGEKRFRELLDLAKSGGISKADFVRETQRQEFQAALAARNIIRTFDLKPEEMAESKSYSDFIKTPDDFEAFVERSRKVSQGGDQKAYEDLYEKIRKTEKQ